MCGITGCIPPSPKIAAMTEALRHRGPDQQATYTDKHVSLGHTRLKILDLSSAAAQPMGLKNTRITHKLETAAHILVFNGEIYNYKELLEELGVQATTTGDTEVVLHAYQKWGVECLQKFNGMFAFALYDKRKKTVFCARDRFGQKPFYYYDAEELFAFASELKALKKLDVPFTLDKNAARLYFSLGFIPSPWSIFSEVKKLPQGHALLYTIATKTKKVWQWYDLPKAQANAKAANKILPRLRQATKRRQLADVPLGAFLSGGIDSTSVVAHLKKVYTFSIGYQEKQFDETAYINLAADRFETQHHHHTYTQTEFENDLHSYAEVFDEPLADMSCFPTMQVCRNAKKHVTVALSGDGGDEIFGGYAVHLHAKRFSFIRKLPTFLRKAIAHLPTKRTLKPLSFRSFQEACRVSLLEPEQFYAASFSKDLYKPEVFAKWTRQGLKNCLHLAKGDFSEAVRLFDLKYKTLGDNFLAKVDRASMASSLEVRSPYLDAQLVELGQQVNKKASVFTGKRALKQALQGVVPAKILRRKKMGFTPPIDAWLSSEDLPLTHVKSIPDVKVFFQEKVFKRNIRPYRQYKFRLLLFNLWAEKWL